MSYFTSTEIVLPSRLHDEVARRFIPPVQDAVNAFGRHIAPPAPTSRAASSAARSTPVCPPQMTRFNDMLTLDDAAPLHQCQLPTWRRRIQQLRSIIHDIVHALRHVAGNEGIIGSAPFHS